MVVSFEFPLGTKLDLIGNDFDERSLAVVTCVKYDDPKKDRLAYCVKTKATKQKGLLGVNKTTLKLIFSFLAMPKHLKPRPVKKSEVQAFAGEIRASYYETSIKTNTNILQMFEDIIYKTTHRDYEVSKPLQQESKPDNKKCIIS